MEVGAWPFPVAAGRRTGVGENGILRELLALDRVEQHPEAVQASPVAQDLDHDPSIWMNWANGMPRTGAWTTSTWPEGPYPQK